MVNSIIRLLNLICFLYFKFRVIFLNFLIWQTNYLNIMIKILFKLRCHFFIFNFNYFLKFLYLSLILFIIEFIEIFLISFFIGDIIISITLLFFHIIWLRFFHILLFSLIFFIIPIFTFILMTIVIFIIVSTSMVISIISLVSRLLFFVMLILNFFWNFCFCFWTTFILFLCFLPTWFLICKHIFNQ